jgi:hypothetical protein
VFVTVVGKYFWKKIQFILFYICFKLICFWCFRLFSYVDVKNNFKKIKNIILIYFKMKNTLKNNRNLTLSYPCKAKKMPNPPTANKFQVNTCKSMRASSFPWWIKKEVWSWCVTVHSPSSGLSPFVWSFNYDLSIN